MAIKTLKSTSCQGEVFHYDQKAQCGLIKGFDRNGYNFVIAEWQNKNEVPRVGMIVNFEIKGNADFKEAVRVRLN